MNLNPFDLLKQIGRKDNVFRELTSQERKDQRAKGLEVKEDIKRLARICADILSDQRYKEFADLFRSIEKNVIDLLINCDEKDRDNFYLKIKEYQIKLRMFRQILRIPHDFIKREQEIQRTMVK